MFFQFAFKTLKQGKGIGSAARKPREYFVMVESSNLPCACFGDYRAQGYLAIAPERHLGATPRRKYGSTVKFWHLN